MACRSRSIVRLRSLLRFLSDSRPPTPLPPPPTMCCMTGCANCVWIEYAEKLVSKYGNCSEGVTKDILSQIDDPSLKAFVEMELMFRLKR